MTDLGALPSRAFRVALAIGAIGWQDSLHGAQAQDSVNPELLIATTDVDPRETARRDPALLYAQAVVAEAGWTARNDHAAILHVLRRRSRLPAFRRDDGLEPTARVALAYIRAFNPRGPLTERQRRMRALDWPLLQERAPSVVRLVRAWMAGRLADPCRAPAWHWGSAVDARNLSLPRVDCGRCTNLYFGAPVASARVPRVGGVVPANLARARH